jgi:hypothetical protein
MICAVLSVSGTGISAESWPCSLADQLAAVQHPRYQKLSRDCTNVTVEDIMALPVVQRAECFEQRYDATLPGWKTDNVWPAERFLWEMLKSNRDYVAKCFGSEAEANVIIGDALYAFAYTKQEDFALYQAAYNQLAQQMATAKQQTDQETKLKQLREWADTYKSLFGDAPFQMPPSVSCSTTNGITNCNQFGH